MRLVARSVLWLHVTLYRLTDRRIGGRFIAGTPILLLTTTGRRTGKLRTRPLAYVRDGDRYVLCASNGGSPHHPGWYHNLRASGRAEIQVRPEQLVVSANTADATERSQLFPRFVDMYKGYAGYEQKTSRQIPLVLLTPVTGRTRPDAFRAGYVDRRQSARARRTVPTSGAYGTKNRRW
jgi:F420H(2)-dependent quinone reductase